LGRILADWLRSLTGLGGRGATLRESVEELIEEHQDDEAPINEQERDMLLNLLNFGELRVEDVMVPRADIVAVSETAELAEVISVMSEAGHSRLPVFRETLDDVIGMVHVRDLLAFWNDSPSFSLAAVVRALPFVPPSMPVQNLLRQMRALKVHMALVVDEHGGIDGLVTIEDLVEEIVGEIEDEHDHAAVPILRELSDGGLEADARVLVDDLEARLKVDLLPADRDDEIDTLGGLVFELAGRVPVTGEVISHEAGLDFEILDADPRRVRMVRVRHRKADDSGAAA
jgi:CBS domain containing-hemolysin-like protein